jgi:hypothetical protein
MTTTRSVDLKARRAARAEAAGEPPSVEFDDYKWELPLELPLSFIEALSRNELTSACRELFGDKGDEFLAVVRPTLEDMAELAKLYGRSLGEASASPNS